MANKGKKVVSITAPNFATSVFVIRGTAPYVQNKFSAKAALQMREAQEAGSTGKKGKKKEGKNFDEAYLAAIHKSEDGWYGIPAPAIRNALIAACKLVGFKMTTAKLAIFADAEGVDHDDGTPLIKITKGDPTYSEYHVRLATGVADLRVRPMWMPGWEAAISLTYDADLFTLQDIANLLLRAGMQVGIGEGRPDSKKSDGMGWGTFELIE
jgi:hypothetical protein